MLVGFGFPISIAQVLNEHLDMRHQIVTLCHFRFAVASDITVLASPAAVWPVCHQAVAGVLSALSCLRLSTASTCISH